MPRAKGRRSANFEPAAYLAADSIRIAITAGATHAPARRAYEKAGFDIKIPNVQYYKKL